MYLQTLNEKCCARQDVCAAYTSEMYVLHMHQKRPMTCIWRRSMKSAVRVKMFTKETYKQAKETYKQTKETCYVSTYTYIHTYRQKILSLTRVRARTHTLSHTHTQTHTHTHTHTGRDKDEGT